MRTSGARARRLLAALCVSACLAPAAPAAAVPVSGHGTLIATVGAPMGSVRHASVVRLAGSDRVGTALAVSRAMFERSSVVVLARADGFADALAGASYAGRRGAPILLTDGTTLSPGVAAEIARLGASQVVLLGGPEAISTRVRQDLERDYDVERLWGMSRYGTAAAIARDWKTAATVYVATGANFPDALAVSQLAGRTRSPVLLVAGNTVPSETSSALRRLDPERLVIVGGPVAVGDRARAQLRRLVPTVRTLAGADRYGTAGAVFDAAVRAGMDPEITWLATGMNYPDALAAGAVIGARGHGLLLVDGGDLGAEPATVLRLRAHFARIRRISLLGGEVVMTANAVQQLRAVASGKLLPGGGTVLLPRRMLVGYYGNAEVSAMGVLGETSPDEADARLTRQAGPYAARGRPLQKVYELIVTVATEGPGPDGDYSAPSGPEPIREYLAAARRHGAILLLDIQPGRSHFLSQVRMYEEFLREPDVGIALDPEWRMESDERPGETIGSVDAAEVNEVIAYVQGLVDRYELPQKLFVVHQFRSDMITNREAIHTPPGLAVTIHVDGFGSQGAKLDTYGVLSSKDGHFFNGFKLFYDEDTDMFEPHEVIEVVDPVPDLVTYQ